jgi:hypothetical protein
MVMGMAVSPALQWFSREFSQTVRTAKGKIPSAVPGHSARPCRASDQQLSLLFPGTKGSSLPNKWYFLGSGNKIQSDDTL